MTPPDPVAEAVCRETLEALRWRDGARCPRCSAHDPVPIKHRKQLCCRACDYRFSVTVGTAFAGSHLPLTKWFEAIELLSLPGRWPTAKQLQRELGVTYKTAWYLWHRIRSEMDERRTDWPRGVARHPSDVFRETLRRLIDGDPTIPGEIGRRRTAPR